MSQEHEKNHPDTQVSDGIHPEAAPFEPGYQPETLPHITVPDLAEDAQGLSAEALSKVPTLTELVEQDVAASEVLPDEVAEVAQPPESAPVVVEDAQAAPSPAEPDVQTQEEPDQADTWGEHFQVRMGKLTDDIHTLHARLDRLEERNKKKV
jgi:hypothetical protein